MKNCAVGFYGIKEVGNRKGGECTIKSGKCLINSRLGMTCHKLTKQ